MMIFRLFYLEELCSRGNLSIVFWFERGAVVRDVPEHPVDFRAMSSIHKILRAVGRNARNDAHRQTEVPVCFIEQKKRGLRKNIKMHTMKWCWGQKRNTPGRIFQYMYTSDSMFTNVHPIPQEAHIVVNYARCAFGLKLFATRYKMIYKVGRPNFFFFFCEKSSPTGRSNRLLVVQTVSLT